MTRDPELDGADSYMGFVGVSTGGSSIRKVFPEWADALRLPTRTLVGHDVALDSPAPVYREVVEAIRDDPQHWGALVTTHKMAVHAAARDLFDDCDDLAETFEEISCIAKRGERLIGSAKDPVTARLALEEFLAPDHFGQTGGCGADPRLRRGRDGAQPPARRPRGPARADHLHRADPGTARPRPADPRAGRFARPAWSATW